MAGVRGFISLISLWASDEWTPLGDEWTARQHKSLPVPQAEKQQSLEPLLGHLIFGDFGDSCYCPQRDLIYPGPWTELQQRQERASWY